MTLHKLLLILLAPLLMLQGKRVRGSMLRLPEASGPRQGSAPVADTSATERKMNVLVLGDSAAAGVGCETQNQGVAGQWVAQLSRDAQVHWQLLAKSSLTCGQVLQMLKQQRLEHDHYDVVLISVGVNDVTRRTTVAQWQADLAALTDYLTVHVKAKLILYTALPPMHKFPALPQPLRWIVGRQAKQLNRHLQAHCDQHRATQLLAFEIPFEAKYIAADGYHPSPHAAKLWAEGAASMWRSLCAQENG